MNKGYIYLVFAGLSGLVVLIIALIFKLSSDTTLSTKHQEHVAGASMLHNQTLQIDNYSESWISKISKQKSQSTFQYPTQTYHIELN